MKKEFNPEEDGWDFANWGETGEFDWDLYKDAYLAIDPQDKYDQMFYPLFKKCAEQGNCGGMSFLALALFKYGGYMGFCSPASFYEGVQIVDKKTGKVIKKAPIDPALHRAINIFQARQFSKRNVNYVIDLFKKHNLNDAKLAWDTVQAQAAKGDYAALAIARDTVATGAHTVIPYKVETSTNGDFVMHIWDSNHPYSADKTHYDDPSTKKLLTISGDPLRAGQDWKYIPDPNADPNDEEKKPYIGSQFKGAWCFAMPMSLVLIKSRQPMTLENLTNQILTLFVGGTGSAVSQISDDNGHRFYTKDADVHTSRLEIETDPEKRLQGAIRWPWFSSDSRQEGSGELYFIRRHKGNTSPLITTVSGANYEFIACMGKNIIEVNSASKEHSRETIKTYGSVLEALSMDVTTTGKKRKVSLNHLLAGATGKEWRTYRLKNIELPKEVPVSINMEKKMNAMTISCPEKKVQFDLEIQQRFNGKITLRHVGKVSTSPGKMLRLAPKEWKNLEKTELIKDISEKDRSE
jgi:hypothetical protein